MLGIAKLPAAIGMLGLAYLSFQFDSVLCGVGAFLLFWELC